MARQTIPTKNYLNYSRNKADSFSFYFLHLFNVFVLIFINTCDTMTLIWAFSQETLERGNKLCQKLI